MRHLTATLLSTTALLFFAACSSPSDKDSSAVQAKNYTYSPSAENIKAHMEFLSSDDLLGRETGEPGYDIAAAYVADQFKALGLKPAGDDGTYFQDISFKRAVRVAEAGNVIVQNSNGDAIPFEAHKDFAIGPNTSLTESTVTAPVVFAGFGIVAPKEGRNDYEGLDVEGKIVATLARTPSGIQTEERAFYGSRKGKEASDRGAIGIISIPTPTSEKVYSFERLINEGRLDGARMTWLQPNGETFSRARSIKGGASLSMKGAEKLFADAPMSLEKVLEQAEAEGGKTSTFDLPVTVTITQKSKIDEVRSANVAGMIEGTDPDLKDEVIVLTAHLDHIGVSKIDEEDVINNGALDNAAGIATLFEAARMMQNNTPPRRSVMFLAVTAEEKGLLGSQYFAKNPTVPIENIVGNVNLDMPVLTYDFNDVIAFGGTRSTFNAAISKAAQEMGLILNPDPMPEQGIFTRSDHFRFVEEGIPSVMLSTGFGNGGAEAWATHFAEHYHRPSDDMMNDLSFEAAAKFSELKTRITFTLANADQRPLWNKGDFFAEQFNGPMIED